MSFPSVKQDVHLAAGLPLTWIRNREKISVPICSRIQKSITELTAKSIISVLWDAALPAGISGYRKRLGDFKGTNLLADIGNGTMNILYINNKKAQESRCWTEKFGVNQCMIAAKNAVLDNFGVKIEDLP